jgi:hypothetical protein
MHDRSVHARYLPLHTSNQVEAHRIIRPWRVAMATLLALASAGRVALGQGLDRISGGVTDSSGAALPGATVTILHAATRLRGS